MSVWYAPDHPSYGQEADEDEQPHPFNSVEHNGEMVGLPHPDFDIILVELNQTKNIAKDKEKIFILKKKKNGKEVNIKRKVILPVAENVIDNYTVDMTKEYEYKPRDMSNEYGEHWDVETIPDYIKIRKLKPKEE